MDSFRAAILGMSAVASVLAGCRDCDRSGCAAMDDKARPRHVQQGIAGVVGFQSDVAGEDLFGRECNECPLFRGTVGAWRAGAPIATAEEALALCGDGGSPDARTDAAPRYELALAPGDWLVCLGGSDCAPARVDEGAITTVNFLDQGWSAKVYASSPGGPPADRSSALWVLCQVGGSDDPWGPGDIAAADAVEP